MAAVKPNPTRRASFTHPLLIDMPKKICLFRADSLARHLLQLACTKPIRLKLVRDMLLFGDQIGKKYHNGNLRKLILELWDEVGEKCNFTG